MKNRSIPIPISKNLKVKLHVEPLKRRKYSHVVFEAFQFGTLFAMNLSQPAVLLPPSKPAKTVRISAGKLKSRNLLAVPITFPNFANSNHS